MNKEINRFSCKIQKTYLYKSLSNFIVFIYTLLADFVCNFTKYLPINEMNSVDQLAITHVIHFVALLKSDQPNH